MDVDTDDLLAFCAGEMPRHMIPKHIVVVEELPKTSSGKMDYPALRRREEVRLQKPSGTETATARTATNDACCAS
jgi:acyl-CoA synthetase (AMP-forming)/AMP-acid ligase II